MEIHTPDEIGAAIRTRRRELGFRQDYLAAAAGVSLQFVSQVERGKATAQIGKVLAVLQAVGIRVNLDVA